MPYTFQKVITGTIEEAIEKTTAALKEEGFGVITSIDVQDTLKKKIDADFRPYVILGACNPHFAYKALQVESRIGTLLPCNVIVQQLESGEIEIAAVDPAASMGGVHNQSLEDIAAEVRTKLLSVIESI